MQENKCKKITLISVALFILVGCASTQMSNNKSSNISVSESASIANRQDEVEDTENISHIEETPEPDDTNSVLPTKILNIDVSGAERNKFSYLFEVVPDFELNQGEHVVVFQTDDYTVQYHNRSIKVISTSEMSEILFEDVRLEEEYDGVPMQEIGIKSVYEENRAFFLTDKQLYFVFMAEMGYNRQTYQIYKWDFATKQLVLYHNILVMEFLSMWIFTMVV